MTLGAVPAGAPDGAEGDAETLVEWLSSIGRGAVSVIVNSIQMGQAGTRTPSLRAFLGKFLKTGLERMAILSLISIP
jgi:hypothetical protein